MIRRIRFRWLLSVWLPLVLNACSTRGGPTLSPVTQAFLTAGVVLTQMAGAQSPTTPFSTNFLSQTPGAMPRATLTPAATSSAGVAAANSSCYRLDFESDVTLPDDTPVQPGATLVKTWSFLNSGSCAWTADTQIVFVSGDPMGGPSSEPIGQAVAVGKDVQISVTLAAPLIPGTYQGYWMLRSPSGTRFGYGPAADQAFWVEIVVLGTPAPTATAMPAPTGTAGPTPTPAPSITPTWQASAAPTMTSTVTASSSPMPTVTSVLTATGVPSLTPAPTPTS